MNKEKEFENILDECLERVMRGEDVQACLARYPEYAAELEPLLKTASAARKAVDIQPRAEFRQRAAFEFQSAIRNMPVKESKGFFKWQVRWVMPVAIVLVVLMAGSGTLVAANNSLPDDPLYTVKLASETVQLAFTPSDLGKAELYAKFADKRVEEIIELADKGEVKQIDAATERMNTQLIAMANITGNNAGTSKDTAAAILQSPAEPTNEAAEARTKQAPVVVLAPAPVPSDTPVPANDAVPVVTPAPPVGTASVPVITTPAPVTATTVPEGPGTPPDLAPAVAVALPEQDANVTQPLAPAMTMPSFKEETTMLAASEAPRTIESYGSGELLVPEKRDGKQDRQSKLKTNLSKKVREHLEKLQEQLENAPDELKPALERAIEVIINGYETNLSNLK
jgi:hypothetical protein